jgi:hypothetical protein
LTEGFDTTFMVPSQEGVAVVMVHLKLDVDVPDLSGLDDLVSAEVLGRIEQVMHRVELPYPWAAEHVLHAIRYLRRGEYLHAWPPLVIGVEGLFWAAAEKRGYIDEEGRFTEDAGRRGKPTNAIDIVLALPLNERVQRMLRKYAFGGSANVFRHGGKHEIGEQEQCRLWLLALVVWIDAYGWDWVPLPAP